MPDGSTKAFASMGLVWELATQVADFRAGNGLPRATPKEALADIEEATCTRLHNDPAHCVQKKSPAARPSRGPLSVAKAAAAGGRILVDWLGSGATPVPIAVAQARANVCFTCPNNAEGHAFLRLTADTVRAIAEQMQAKDAMKLRVIDEEQLKACRVCLCPLQLKVHVPIGTILAHTDQDTLNAFPAWCWVTNERPQPL